MPDEQAWSRTDALVGMLARKHDCLVRLDELSRRQLELVGDPDVVQLLKLLAEKQQAISQLQAIERELDPFRGEDPTTRRWRHPDLRTRCEWQVEQCDGMFRRIMLQEKESEHRLQSRRDATAAQLQAASAARQARDAYDQDHDIGQLDLASEG